MLPFHLLLRWKSCCSAHFLSTFELQTWCTGSAFPVNVKTSLCPSAEQPQPLHSNTKINKIQPVSCKEGCFCFEVETRCVVLQPPQTGLMLSMKWRKVMGDVNHILSCSKENILQIPSQESPCSSWCLRLLLWSIKRQFKFWINHFYANLFLRWCQVWWSEVISLSFKASYVQQ